MRYGTFLFFRNLEIHPDDIMAIYEVDPYRWSWMRGADERLPIYFLFRNGRKWIQIKHPPKGLAESISEECDVELIRSSRARFIHDFIDLRHS